MQQQKDQAHTRRRERREEEEGHKYMAHGGIYVDALSLFLACVSCLACLDPGATVILFPPTTGTLPNNEMQAKKKASTQASKQKRYGHHIEGAGGNK